MSTAGRFSFVWQLFDEKFITEPTARELLELPVIPPPDDALDALRYLYQSPWIQAPELPVFRGLLAGPPAGGADEQGRLAPCPIRCECGGEKAGTTHSAWCPVKGE